MPDSVTTVTLSPFPMPTVMTCVNKSVGEITGSTHINSGVGIGQGVVVLVGVNVGDSVGVKSTVAWTD